MGLERAFLEACKNGKKVVVETFLKKGGIDINYRDDKGNTALMVQYGADGSLADNGDKSARDYAVQYGFAGILDVLL
jgi:hypothetical protein